MSVPGWRHDRSLGVHLMSLEESDVLSDAAERQAEAQARVGKSEFVPSRELWVDYPESEAEQAWRAYEEWCER